MPFLSNNARPPEFPETGGVAAPEPSVFADAERAFLESYRVSTGCEFLAGAMPYPDILDLRKRLAELPESSPNYRDSCLRLVLLEYRRLRQQPSLSHWSDARLIERAREFARL